MGKKPVSPSSPLEVPPSLKVLFQARNELDRVCQLSNILKEARIDLPDFFDCPVVWSTICREIDPDKLAWKLGQEIRRRTGGQVPRVLIPYLERPDFAREQQAQELARFQGELQQWLMPDAESLPSAPRRELRVVWTLEETSNPLAAKVSIQLRANSPKLKEGPRNFFQVRGLCHELAHRPEIFNPEDSLLLRWLSDYQTLLLSEKQKTGSPFLADNRSLLAWLQQWGTTGRCKYDDGKPVEFSPLAARIVPTLEPSHGPVEANGAKNGNGTANGNGHANGNGATNGNGHAADWHDDRAHEAYDEHVEQGYAHHARAGHGAGLNRIQIGFEVTTAAGLRAPLSDAKLFLSTREDSSKLELELLVVNGCFYRIAERPPSSLLALASKNGPAQFETAAVRRLLPALISRYPSLQAQVRVHLRQVPSQIRYYFTLDEDDSLCVRLQAKSKDGKQAWEWGGCGWNRLAPGEVGAAPVSEDRKEADTLGELPAPPPPDAGEEITLGAAATDEAGVPIEPLAEVWDEIPAENDSREAITWLQSWGGEPGELFGRHDEPGWWLHLHGQRVGRLLQLWQDRCLTWQYYGNKRFQHLISGRRRAFPKIRVQPSGMDWFTVKAEWEEESLRLTDTDWHKLRANSDPFIKLSDGTWLAREQADELQQAAGALAELGLSMSAEEQRINTLQLTTTPDETWDKLTQFGRDDWREGLERLKVSLAEFQGIPPVELPKGLHAELRPYQHEGLNFLVYTSQLRLGAILADDMGLGKTVQTLAWLQFLKERSGGAPSLVVCPASVVFNWQREAKQFVPDMKVMVLAAGGQRHSLRSEIPGHDLIIINYALLRRDLAELKKFSFRAVVLDEAQNIKNPDSMVARAARVLVGEHRVALTGTPLENRLLDLWSLAEFVLPGYLPARNRFIEQHDRAATPQSRTLLSSRLRPLILRRLKSQVASDLPERIEERIDCELTEGQRKFYLAELARSRQQLRESDPADSHARIHALAALTRLRQICCHPALAGGKKVLGSGKTASFLDLIEPLFVAGHKVLVFSQFVEMLKILQIELEARQRPHYMLTGQTANRAEVVENFQADPRAAVFLLSLKAAGTGLNLTSASYVILYDPWWNPAVEAQAIDRTHRIGQHRTVIAYRLVSRDTVEEKIWHLQQQKAQLFKDVLGEQGFTNSLSLQDIEYLLEAPDELAPTPSEPKLT